MLKEVEEAYSAAVKQYATYKKALRLSVRKTRVKLLKSQVTRLKEVVNSIDENVKKAA